MEVDKTTSQKQNTSYTNIMDQPVPEINVPILKPVKATNNINQKLNITNVNNIQKKLNEFADWIMSYIPQEVKKSVNQRLEQLKTTVNNIYNRIKPQDIKKGEAEFKIFLNKIKKPQDIQKIESSIKGFLTTYRIKGVDKIDPKIYLTKNKDKILDLIHKETKPIKMKLLLEVEFFKNTQHKTTEYSYSHFHSQIHIITQGTNMNDIYSQMTDKILESFGNFQKNGSGWRFNKIIQLDIHIDKYTPVSSKSWINLPKELKAKKKYC